MISSSIYYKLSSCKKIKSNFEKKGENITIIELFK